MRRALLHSLQAAALLLLLVILSQTQQSLAGCERLSEQLKRLRQRSCRLKAAKRNEDECGQQRLVYDTRGRKRNCDEQYKPHRKLSQGGHHSA
ncbi:hypothetical protein D3C78_1067330 [compost metagenome]